jgi:hypothetical protein
MLKIYPDMIKLYTFKNPFKKNDPDYERPTKLTRSSGNIHSSVSHLTDEEISKRDEKIAKRAEENLDRSLRRTRQTLADLVACNDFDMFVTFTFDQKKHPRTNEKDYAAKILTYWLNNQQRLHGPSNYLLVMERHKSGYWHAHALLGGFKGKYHATILKGNGNNKRQQYKIDSWEKSNGFADMSFIGNKNALGLYVGKYITKEINTVSEGKKRYWASKNLKKPEKVYNWATLDIRITDLAKQTTFENDYCKITTIPRKQTRLIP